MVYIFSFPVFIKDQSKSNLLEIVSVIIILIVDFQHFNSTFYIVQANIVVKLEACLNMTQ